MELHSIVEMEGEVLLRLASSSEIHPKTTFFLRLKKSPPLFLLPHSLKVIAILLNHQWSVYNIRILCQYEKSKYDKNAKPQPSQKFSGPDCFLCNNVRGKPRQLGKHGFISSHHLPNLNQIKKFHLLLMANRNREVILIKAIQKRFSGNWFHPQLMQDPLSHPPPIG